MDGSINTIKVTDVCSFNACVAGTTMNIQITGVNNPSSIMPIQNFFEIRTYTPESYLIDYGNSTNFGNLSLRTDSFT